ncbi:MAG TPA: hypothetical protein VKK79_01745 [Candidatus Lokiarchaeia archaeon]|nr:hypothetical protein [Candidatus Lokiarchaeia archaeon]
MAMQPSLSTGENLSISTVSPKSKITQVFDTIVFEIQRNLRKTLYLLVLVGVFFVLDVILTESNVSKGILLPDDSRDFVANSLGSMSDIIYLIAVVLGSSSIAADFEKQTGHMLFPKVSRTKLLVGRIGGLYLLFALLLGAYYGLAALYTITHYAAVPWEIWESFGTALLVALAALSFVIFISSWMKSVAGAAVLGLLFLFIIFSSLLSLYSVFTTDEPILLLTYYANIITNIMKMPDTRYTDYKISVGTITINERMWATPDPITAVSGCLIYAGVSLFLSYLIFRRRQLAS